MRAAAVFAVAPQLSRPRPLRMLWITAALGTCFLLIQWGLRDAPVLWFAALRALLGGAALTAVVLVQRRPMPGSLRSWGAITVLGVVNVSLAFAAMSAAHLVIGGLVLSGAALAVEGTPVIAWTPRFLAVLAFLGVIATAATTLAWFVEAQRCPVSRLTPWLFLVPVVGLVLGIALLGERPGGWTAAGVALVLLSMRVALRDHGRSTHTSTRSSLVEPPRGGDRRGQDQPVAAGAG